MILLSRQSENELLMSQAERDRLVCLKKASESVITRAQAAAELESSERQVYRLLAALKAKGDQAAIHGLRGRSSNRKLSAELERQTIEILKQEVYQGFGPTLASEYLASKHGILLSKETVRQLRLRAGLRQAKRARGGAGACMAATASALRGTSAMGYQRARLGGRTWREALSDQED